MYFVAKPNEEAKAFIQAAGLIDETQCRAVGTLVIDLKNYNLWDKMKAIYPMVGQADVSSSFQFNLKNPSLFKGTFSGSWVFSSTGATPDGTSAYMDTGFVIGGNISLPSIHLTYYSRTNNIIASPYPTEIGVGFGGGGLSYYELNVRRASQFSTILNDGYTIVAAATNTDSSGFYIANRTSNINLNIWKNGTKLSTITTLSTFLNVPTNNILIAASKDGSSAISNFSNRQCALATIGDSLTDTEAANLYTAVQRFQTTLGRQV